MIVTEERLNKIVQLLKDNDIYGSTCLGVSTDENGVEPTLLDRIYIDGSVSFDLLNEVHNILIDDIVKKDIVTEL